MHGSLPNLDTLCTQISTDQILAFVALWTNSRKYQLTIIYYIFGWTEMVE